MIIPVTQAQRSIITSPARYRTLMCGRRWGKTMAARADMIMKCLGRTKVKYAYIAPKYSQTRPEYEWFLYHPALAPLYADHGCRTQPYPVLTFKSTGSEMQFRTFEQPDNIRGRGLDFVWFDEIQSMKRSTQFWPVIRPMLFDRRGGLTISGQFKGKNWYFEQLYLKGLREEGTYDAKYESWRFPTMTGMCAQGPDGLAEIEAMRAQMSQAQWDQECECIPCDSGATYFRWVDGVVHEVPIAIDERGRPFIPPIPGEENVLFWDLGQRVDPAAVVVMAKNSGTVCIANEIQCGTKFDAQLEYVAALANYYNATCAMDYTGAGTVDNLLDVARKKIPNMRGIVFGRSNKPHLLNLTAVAIERQTLRIAQAFRELTQQLKRYEYEQTEHGDYIYHAPKGEHDDVAMALVGCVYMRQANWGDSTAAGHIDRIIG